MKRKINDLTGKFFGDIEVLSKIGTKGHNNLWRCLCHACNKEKELISPLLRTTTKSCGCKKIRQNKDSPNWICNAIINYNKGKYK